GGSMSVVAKGLIVVTAATASVAGWAALGRSRGESQQMVEETGNKTAAIEAPVATDAADPRRDAWERRKLEIRRVLPALPERAPTPARPSDALRAAFRECMRDLGVTGSGALTIDLTEIGAPDIGTIYESVEIVETTFPDKEVLTCLTE